jgi:hypothetical protein
MSVRYLVGLLFFSSLSPAMISAQVRREPPSPNYSLKGSRLGSPLAEFKVKHASTCTDEFVDPAEPQLKERVKVGLVECAIEASPDLAGRPTKTFTASFIDGTLYRMLVTFDRSEIVAVGAALRKQYAEPAKRAVLPGETRIREFKASVFEWHNETSRIMLFEAFGAIDESALVFDLPSLRTEAERREKGLIPRL